MAQNPLVAFIAKKLSNNVIGPLITDDDLYLLAKLAQDPDDVAALLNLDAVGGLITTKGGTSASLNLTAAAAIKATPGRIAKAVIIAPGSTSGTFTLNNCATTGAAAAGNVVWTLPYNSTMNIAGTIFDLDMPCSTGITLSAVPGGGSPIIAVSYR